MGSNDSNPGLLRSVEDRCSELEASQASLRAQLNDIQKLSPDDVTTSSSDWVTSSLPGNFGNSPYCHVLKSLGHAVHVTKASSGEIIYWNTAAEKLYGWKDYEAVGHCFWEFLIDAEFAPSINKIMEKLRFGQSWSGQFPFKKKSGDTFMAIVTKSPLYEDGELIGVITVSSDAAVFNSVNSSQSKSSGFAMKRIHWQQRPQIASVPQMTSSISDMASKVLSRRRSEDIPRESDVSVSDVEYVDVDRQDIDMAKCKIEEKTPPKEESPMAQPAKFAAKLLAKLHIKSTGKNAEASEGNASLVQNGLLPQKANNDPCSPRDSKETTSDVIVDARISPFPVGFPVDDKVAEPELEKTKSGELDDAGARNSLSTESPINNNDSPTSKMNHEASSVVDSDIRWEDLQLGEEIGQGSFAVVFHGLWNGSDVAIKVYFGKDYSEGTLLDYKKEIGIMRKLRHPNVLLFMGACYSHERLAIVTEFLPRGSLFKILHRSNQGLDIKRRLRMALDVARGMNYLHRRNPPIVHRDLKSSNLLVDKNWNVKVGDFGLSKLKHATFLTAKSGGGTPQWMAPEVLRNEPSNEKSDVFSFGVILWELVTVSVPWGSLNSLQVVGVVGFMDRRLDLPEGIDPRIASIINDCWESKPEMRPSFQDIIQRMSVILGTSSGSTSSPVRRALPSS